MVRVRVDIPIFYATKAFGNVSGEMVLDELPEPHSHFRWPAGWIKDRPSYFTPEQSLIASVTAWTFGAASHLVLMYGIACNSLQDAKECAAYLECAANFEIDQYLT